MGTTVRFGEDRQHGIRGVCAVVGEVAVAGETKRVIRPTKRVVHPCCMLHVSLFMC